METENMSSLKSDMLPVLKKLAEDAAQAKKLAELQALKNNHVEVSVDQVSIRIRSSFRTRGTRR